MNSNTIRTLDRPQNCPDVCVLDVTVTVDENFNLNYPSWALHVMDAEEMKIVSAIPSDSDSSS